MCLLALSGVVKRTRNWTTIYTDINTLWRRFTKAGAQRN